jgi:integrase
MMTKRNNQMGSISRHRGWWVLRYRETSAVGGMLKTVLRARRLAPIDSQHKTRASVRQLAAELLQPLNRLPVSPFGVTTLEDFVERVYLPFVKQQKRASTYQGYSQMWNLYLGPRCQNTWLREVKTHQVQRWLEKIAREHNLSKTTLAHIKNLLSGIFRHAAQQGYFDGANPVKLAEIPAFAPNAIEGYAYSLEEIGQMLRLLSLRASAIVATAAYTGLRLGELRGLTWDAYVLPENENELGLIYVRRSLWRGNIGQPKTEKSKAAVPVVPQLAEKLAKFRKSIGNPLKGPMFANSAGNPMDLNATYYREMRPVLQKARLVWVGWHGFRRGLASNLNRLGVDDSVIQAILRHSDVSVTQRCYIKTTRPDAIAAMRQLSAKLSELLKQASYSSVREEVNETETAIQ